MRRLGRRRWWLVVPVVLVVGGGATGAWLLARDPSAASTPVTVTVSTQTVQQTVAASGTVEPAHTADLDFEVPGTVTDVYVDAGDKVRKGQLLARVGTASLSAARNAASASLDAAEEQLDQDEDDDVSDTQLAADQTAVVAARAGLDEAQQDLDDATLRATISGTVASVDLEVGDVVSGSSASGSDDSGDSESQVSIVSTRDFVVSATVSSADVESVKKGLQAQITPTGASQTVYGTVKEVGVVAQTSSSGAAVFPVTIEVTGQHSDLYAGTSADASVIVSQRDGVLVVPSRALQADGDATYVDKVVGDKTVRTTVQIGQTYGANTEVVSGLADGDVVELPGFTVPQGGGNGDRGELPGGATFFQDGGPGGGPGIQQGGPVTQQGGPGQ